ncbi:MAG: hypothetical protein QM698_12375 [Micropepsaceae bacterium]
MRILTAALFAASMTFAASAASPACDLLTTEEASAALGGTAMAAGSTEEVSGTSGCGWIDAATSNTISFGLMHGEAFGGATADQAYEGSKTGAGMGAAVEDLSGIGDKAFIVTPQGMPANMFVMSVVKGSSMLSINAMGVTREALITAATAAAGRMP